MLSVPQVVEKIVRNAPFYEEGLSKGLINLSSLAREVHTKIEEETRKKVKMGTIVMALKRLSIKLKDNPANLKRGLSIQAGISVKSNLFEITYPVNDQTLARQKELFERFSQKKGLFLTVTQGNYELTMVASDEIRKEVVGLFKNEKPISVLDNLSSLTIHLSKDAINIPGIFYQIIKIMAWEGIPIVEAVSTFTEFSLILNNNDVARAFNLLRQLFNELK